MENEEQKFTIIITGTANPKVFMVGDEMTAGPNETRKALKKQVDAIMDQLFPKPVA